MGVGKIGGGRRCIRVRRRGLWCWAEVDQLRSAAGGRTMTEAFAREVVAMAADAGGGAAEVKRMIWAARRDGVGER